MHWSGLTLADFKIGETLGEGSFSRVYAVTGSGGERFALKVAAPAADSRDGGATGYYQSRALERITSGFAEFSPDPAQLLELQYEFLTSVGGEAFVRVYELVREPGFCYIKMDLLDGRSLRDLMREQGVGLELLRGVVAVMEKLETLPGFTYHGDLKPENIMIVGGRPVLIDPGFYGTLRRDDGRLCHAAITTPEYYPQLNADDLLALGLVIWEVTTGHNLLGEEAEPASPGPGLAAKIEQIECTGNFFFSPITGAVEPRRLKEMPAALSEFVAAAVRLRFDARGGADLAQGFKSFAELGAAFDRAVSAL